MANNSTLIPLVQADIDALDGTQDLAYLLELKIAAVKLGMDTTAIAAIDTRLDALDMSAADTATLMENAVANELGLKNTGLVPTVVGVSNFPDYPITVGESYCYDPATKKLLPEVLAIGNGILGTLAASGSNKYVSYDNWGMSSFITHDGICWVAVVSNNLDTSSGAQYISMYKRLPQKGAAIEYVQSLPVSAGSTSFTSNWGMTQIIECGTDIYMGGVSASYNLSNSDPVRPFKLEYDRSGQTFTLTQAGGNMSANVSNSGGTPSVPVIYDGVDSVMFFTGANTVNNVYSHKVNVSTMSIVSNSIPNARYSGHVNMKGFGNRQHCNSGAWLLSDGNYLVLGWHQSAGNEGGVYSESGGSLTQLSSNLNFVSVGLQIEQDTFLRFYTSGDTLYWKVFKYNTATQELDTFLDVTYLLGQEPTVALTLGVNHGASRIGDYILFHSAATDAQIAVIKFDPVTFEVDTTKTNVNMTYGETHEDLMESVSWDERGVAIQILGSAFPAIGVFSAGALIKGLSPVRLGYLTGNTGADLDISVLSENYQTSGVTVGATYANGNYVALSDTTLVPFDKRPEIWARHGLETVSQSDVAKFREDTRYNTYGTLALDAAKVDKENTYISFDSTFGKSFYAEGFMFNASSNGQACRIGVAVDGMLRTETFSANNTSTVFPQFVVPHAINLDVSGQSYSTNSGEVYITYAVKEEK